MPVRTRRMKNSRKGVRLPDESSSSEEDIEMSLLAKSMVDELDPIWIQESKKRWRHSMRIPELNNQWFKKMIRHSYYSKF